MILKASKRGGARQLARHLMNGDKNEHVTLHEVSGFASDNISDALDEIHAISKGTRCTRFMFSLSLSPPQNESVPAEIFEDALSRIEKKLGLENQPRIIVFHEKHGRRHAHCVWSRINAMEMKAIDLPFFKNRLMEISKQLYLDHGWQMPKGFIAKHLKNPLNFTRSEWEQAARTGQNPKAIKSSLQECWATSDNKKSFEQALQERGYYLAKGDRRGFVVIDINSEVYSLTRQLGTKKKELVARIGSSSKLPSIKDVKNNIITKVSKIYNGFLLEQSKDHQKDLLPLLKIKQVMTAQHRKDRAAQKSYQESRWQKEELKRVSKIRKGFKGLWDKLNGKYWKQRKSNEIETRQCDERDKAEREHLIKKQLIQRQNLQVRLTQLQLKHEKDRLALISNLSHMASTKDKATPDFSNLKEHSHNHAPANNSKPQKDKDLDNPDIDMEPDI